ncbi:protein DBF4 homolog B isoform X2 [Myiozetetes cayanensis]|uniref:protein DBF4 homolog B isoform X2 n=1 Tax=Myiozetetes cayanensis TaxID=478635 RepID=UPI00215E9ECF|nr:protein DBF4 homolog B isoform X2 [Myiozetetes cayanensis]
MAGTAPGSARPLRGQSFYLDLPAGTSARHLAEAIERLGGVTESFLSKEVTCVVSSNKEAKRGRAGTGDGKQSHPTSGDTNPTSSGPAASRGNPPRPHQKPPDTALLSRGKELLQKAMKKQDTCSGSSILANARLWGVQILHVDDMVSYAQQLLRAISGARKRCQKTEGRCLASGSKIHKGKLKPPFLKVEDQSRQFRPFHHQFQSFPHLNFLAPKSCSPFEPLKSLSNPCQARAEGSDGGKSPRSSAAPRKRRGFCECCQETFEELQKHLQSPRHQRFAQDDSQYLPVDRVISQLTHSSLQCSHRVPQSYLADEHLVPQAHGTGELEMLTELGKEREQPEQGTVELVMDTEQDHDLEIKGCSPCLPGDRVRDPREGGGLSEQGSVGLPRGAELSGGVCAAHGTTEGAGLGPAGLGSAPALGWESCAAAAPPSEPRGQQVPGSVSHPPAALPVPRKRQLSPSQSSQVGKRPRLEQGQQMGPVRGGLGAQGAGQMPGPGLPGVPGAGRLALHTQLCSRPRGSLALDPCPGGSPGDPGSPGAVDAAGAAPASAAGERGWSGAGARPAGQQLRWEDGATPGRASNPGLESTASGRSSCPTGRPPAAGARCCCSVCVGAAEKASPEAAELPGHSAERAPCPGLLPPPARSTRSFGESSSESDWDVQLLPGVQGSGMAAGDKDVGHRTQGSGMAAGDRAVGHRTQGSGMAAGDRDVLHRTQGSVGDSGYECRLRSVLRRDPQPGWAAQDSGSCRTCCTGTTAAPFPVLETFCGSWTS